MKSVVLAGLGNLEIKEIPAPSIKESTQVLLKVSAVGICGSDIHYFKEGGIGEQRVTYPFSIGHECTAVVDSVGKQVSRVAPGDRVVIDPLISCGRCPQCKSGRRHTCLNSQFLGCPGQMDGALSEYIVLPQECCYKLPSNVGLSEGVIVEPLSIGMYACRLLGICSEKKAAVLGSGPIGLSVLAVLKHQGIESVFVTDKIDDRLNVAEKAGADWTGNPNNEDVVGNIQDLEHFLLDAVFECCGDQEALDQAVQILKPGGSLLIVGIPEAERVEFDIHVCRRKEISILNVRRQNECMSAAVDFLASQREKLVPWLTHEFLPETAMDAFDLVAMYADNVIKAVIRMDGILGR